MIEITQNLHSGLPIILVLLGMAVLVFVAFFIEDRERARQRFSR